MKYKHIIGLSLAGTGCAFLLRLLQLLALTDAATGFGKLGSPYFGLNITVYLVTFIMALAIFFVSFYLSKRQPAAAPDMSLSPSLSVFCFIMTVFHMLRIGKFLLMGGEITSSSGAIFTVLQLLSALFYVLYGVSGFSPIKFPRVLTIIPILTCGYDLVSAFLGYTGMANISDNVYECLFLSISLFFFLLHGKIISSVTIRRSSRIILPTALLAVFFGIIASLPPIMTALLGSPSLLHSSPLNSLPEIFPTTYIFVFTINLYRK